MIEFDLRKGEKDSEAKPVSVAIIGVGGAGANVLDRIALDGIHDGDLVTMNTDVRALTNSVAPTKVQLGKTLTQGLGAGGDPDLGLEAARNSEADIADAVRGRDMVFICTGLGGGTGSGAAPHVAEIAKREGAFVTVFATLPFSFEGKRRLEQAEGALAKIGGNTDALLTFENDRMGSLVLPKHGIQEAFTEGDKLISQAVRAITNLVTKPGLINIGMDDLITALKNHDSRCLFGFGEAKGDSRAQDALKQALKSPLLDKGVLLDKAHNVLVQVCGGEKMTLFETELVMTELDKHVHDRAQILFGVATDTKMGEKLSVTVVSSLSSEEPGGGDDGAGDDAEAATSSDASSSGIAAASAATAVAAAVATAPAPEAKAAPEPEPEPELVIEPEPEPEPEPELVVEPEPEPEPEAVEEPVAVAAAEPEAAGLGETLDLSGLVDEEPEPEPEPLPVMEELNDGVDDAVGDADEFIVDEPAANDSIGVANVAKELAAPPKVDIVPEVVSLEDESDDFVEALVAEELDGEDDLEIADAVEPEPEPEPVEPAEKPSPFIPKGFIPKGLKRPLPVATAKKASKVKVKEEPAAADTEQQNFDKTLEPASKGRFDKGEPTVEDGEDLDIPTFLRQKPE